MPQVSMKATISTSCMFIRVDDATNVETQFVDSEFWNFLKFMKNGQQHHKTLFKVLFP